MVNAAQFVISLFRWPAKLFIRSRHIPANNDGRKIDPSKPIIYLLKTQSATDMMALERAAKEANMPSPFSEVLVNGEQFPRCIAIEKVATPFMSHKKARLTGASFTFRRLFRLQKKDPQMDVQIVPVSVFWGRSPDQEIDGKERILWGAISSPSWLSKLFVVLISGRNSFVMFSPFVSSLAMMNEKSSDDGLAQKLLRVARVHFRRKQQAIIGPGQFNREHLHLRLMASNNIKQAIQDEAENKNISVEKARARANKYFEEVAADFRPGLLGIFSGLLTLMWNKIYSGIEVRNFDRVRETAQKGHEIIYVPCHRSHMDYLLLTYVIYHQGMATPHIAAGVNLNFWPAGPIFRRSGAFFIRRTFKGNRLYTLVFREYLDQLFNLGYPVKYYCEGGRSRTGRLLPPKTGMIAMTLQSVLRGIDRPVSLVPVYLGYEHVMEVAGYLKELKGNAKQKESITQIFGAIRKLKNFGRGYVSFGEPINLTQFLTKQQPDWNTQDNDNDSKPRWLNPVVNSLANQVHVGINKATAVNSVTLVSMSLLASEKRALSRNELINQLKVYLHLLRSTPYHGDVYVPDVSAEELLQQALEHNKFQRTKDQLGEIISLDDTSSIVMTYYRNNIKHLFVIPAIIASIVVQNKGAERKQIIQLVSQLYPIFQNEWFIELEDVEAYANDIISEFKQLGMLQQSGRKLVAASVESNQFFDLALLGRIIQDSVQRYSLVLSIVEQQQLVSRSELEKQSQQLAKRLSALHGINAPEFFDKKVIGSLIGALRDHQLGSNDEGLLEHSESSRQLMHNLIALVDFEVRQTIQHK